MPRLLTLLIAAAPVAAPAVLRAQTSPVSPDEVATEAPPGADEVASDAPSPAQAAEAEPAEAEPAEAEPAEAEPAEAEPAEAEPAEAEPAEAEPAEAETAPPAAPEPSAPAAEATESAPPAAPPPEPTAAASAEDHSFLSVDSWLPEDRGGRGWFIGGGGGLVVGFGADEDGESSGTFLGSGGHFRFGEEVFEGFTLGLEIWGGGGDGGGDQPFSAGLGALFVQATVRPFESAEPLVFLLASGIGGGAFTPEKDGEGPEGGTGGAMYQVGTVYEFELSENDGGGWRVGPSVAWTFAPTIGDGEVFLSTFVVGVESVWYAGR